MQTKATLRTLLKPVYTFLEKRGGYSFVQILGRPTTNRFRRLIQKNIHPLLRENQLVLDLACGIGSYRNSFPCNYFGIDINPDYIAAASQNYPGDFRVMDCSKLEFDSGKFDHVVMIAATHHLSDDELLQGLAEALRVLVPGGYFHIIDAVLPRNRLHLWKELWFRLDRGHYPRYSNQLLAILKQGGNVADVANLDGPLHDVIYVRLTKPTD